MSECTFCGIARGEYDAVWHFHVHVFPRWRRDELYEHHGDTRWTTAEERAPYAEALRAAIRQPGS